MKKVPAGMHEKNSWERWPFMKKLAQYGRSLEEGYNLKKHRVSFDEAATIFNDPRISTISDPDHSDAEERYISLGKSILMRLPSVIHTYREEKVRLISARKATKAEKKAYEND